MSYQADAGGAAACYPVTDGMPTLVSLRHNGRTVTIVGTRHPFTNENLGRSGNAALATGILGANEVLMWVRPTAAEVVGSEQEKPLSQLLPAAVPLAVLQTIVALLVVALWRGRRLGPVVVEPLPVVVRSVETTDGRGRLYRRAGARDRSADLLRGAGLARLKPALGVPPDAPAEAVIASVTAASGRDPAEVARLLYGPPPDDDSALVRLATELDALDQEARQP